MYARRSARPVRPCTPATTALGLRAAKPATHAPDTVPDAEVCLYRPPPAVILSEPEKGCSGP